MHYRPGQQLAIPIEGGGAVYLKGEVYEQQPKIAFDIPLEPPSNQLSMRGPVLISEGRVLAGMSGGGATALPGWDGAARRIVASFDPPAENGRGRRGNRRVAPIVRGGLLPGVQGRNAGPADICAVSGDEYQIMMQSGRRQQAVDDR